MPQRESDSSESALLFARAISRWENEGGAGGECVRAAEAETMATAVPLTNAELVQLQIRVIAIETLLTVLLAQTSDRQLCLARKMAAYISPRPGSTPHRLTVHAAARITSMTDRADYLRALPDTPTSARTRSAR